jgi:hypothetical protein
MTSNAYTDEKLGGSNENISAAGCFVTSMANSEYSYKNLQNNSRNPDLILKISRDKTNFDGSLFNFGQYGKDLFGNNMETVSKGKDNSNVLNKLNELKDSEDTYAVFGIFTTEFGDHMVPLNDIAGDDKSFSDAIVKSSQSDDNWDNRFDEKNLVEIRFFKISEGQ